MRPYNILIMKRILIFFIVFVSATNLLAQHKFNPNKFKVEIHQYIVNSANLTEQESAKLLPIYDEMISKQRVLHKQLRKLQNSNLQNNKNAKSVISSIFLNPKNSPNRCHKFYITHSHCLFTCNYSSEVLP